VSDERKRAKFAAGYVAALLWSEYHLPGDPKDYAGVIEQWVDEAYEHEMLFESEALEEIARMTGSGG